MAKLNLADIGAGFGLITTYNANNALIEAAIENTLSRDGSSPNQMDAVIDMNSFRIINLADGIDPQDAVTKFQLDQVGGSGLPPGALDDILVNDGSMFVTSSVIAEKYVTDHEAALTITESQISDLAHTTDASDLISGVLADARVQESNVTQHQAALVITESQISDLQAYLLDITGEPIGDLSDVNDVAPADLDVLIYNFANSRYENRQLTGSDIPANATFGGTPNNTEIAVFTGIPGQIEGDDNFLWDGSTLSIFDAGTTDGLVQGHDGLKYNFSFAASNSVDFTGSTSSYQFDRAISIGGIGGFAGQALFIDDVPGQIGAQYRTNNINHSGANVGSFSFTGMTELSVQAPLKVFTYTFPVADGSADQIMATDGAGVLTFRDSFGGGGGLLSGQYRFSTSTVAADPGSGLFRYNSATPASVTEVFIDDVTSNGVDISNILGLITTGDRLYMQSEASPDAFVVFDVSAPATDNTGWFTLTGTVVASGVLHGSNVRTLFVLQIGGGVGAPTGDVFKVGSPNDNEVGVWTGDGTIEGDSALTFTAGVLNSTRMRTGFGNSALPAHSFTGETGTGIYRQSAGILGFSMLGSNTWFMRTTHFHANLANGPAMVAEAPSATNAVFAQDFQDLTSGLGGISGFPALIGSGVTLAETIAAASGGLRVNNTLTGAGIERVLTTSDLVAPVAEINDLTAAVVWANVPDGNITESSVTQHQAALSITESQISDLQAYGFGDLTEVGANGADQVAVFNDALGGIRGDTGFRWDGTNIINANFGGQLRGSSVRAGAIQNETGSSTNPVVLPNKDDLDTGLGASAADEFSLIAGGVEGFRVTEAAAVIELTAFGDLSASNAAGPAFLNEAATDLNPTLIPNRSDPDTGMGWAFSGMFSLIGNGAELARGFAPSLGGLHVNNQLTGSALERVLTVSDLPVVVQARRTSNLTLTTAFVDVTMDTTDIETDAAVLDHDLAGSTDNIIAGVTGLYRITYAIDAEATSIGDSNITLDARVRVNDTGVGIPGSDVKTGTFEDASIDAEIVGTHVSQTFYVNLTASDFITLQVEKVELAGSEDYEVTRVQMTAERVQ